MALLGAAVLGAVLATVGSEKAGPGNSDAGPDVLTSTKDEAPRPLHAEGPRSEAAETADVVAIGRSSPAAADASRPGEAPKPDSPAPAGADLEKPAGLDRTAASAGVTADARGASTEKTRPRAPKKRARSKRARSAPVAKTARVDSPGSAASPADEPSEERPAERATQDVGVGTLRINADPYADITVDGMALGPTPIVGARLSAGRHVVRATHPTLGKQTKTVRVRAGKVTGVTFDFRR